MSNQRLSSPPCFTGSHRNRWHRLLERKISEMKRMHMRRKCEDAIQHVRRRPFEAGIRLRPSGGSLQVGPPLSMPDEKPAGRIAGVWEQAMYARLHPRWIKNELVLPVLMVHRVVVVNGYAAKGLVLGRQTIAKYAIVRDIRNSQQTQRHHQQSQSDSPEPWAGFIAFDIGHPLNYTRARTGPETAGLTILHRKTRSDSVELIGKPATRRSIRTSKGQRKMMRMIMIRCSRRAGREPYQPLRLSSKCGFQLRPRGCAASTSIGGLSLVDLRSASDGTTTRHN